MDRQSGAEDGWRKGPWTAQEDKLLIDHVNLHGEGRWNCVSKLTGLRRSGKSCRLRWVNYLRPDLKRGKITPEEENVILELHALWGNRWSTIARSLPGRTDNEIKNYWRTHFKKSRPSAKSGTARARYLNIRRQHHHHHHHQQQQMDEVRASLMALNNQVTVAQDVRQEMSTYVQQQLQGAASAIAGDGSTAAAAAAAAAAEEDYCCSGSWASGSLWNWSLQDDGLQYHGLQLLQDHQTLQAFYCQQSGFTEA